MLHRRTGAHGEVEKMGGMLGQAVAFQWLAAKTFMFTLLYDYFKKRLFQLEKDSHMIYCNNLAQFLYSKLTIFFFPKHSLIIIIF